MQQAFGYSPLKAGFAYVPLAFSVAAGAGIASGLVTKMAARPVVMMGLTLTVAGLLLMWRAPPTAATWSTCWPRSSCSASAAAWSS